MQLLHRLGFVAPTHHDRRAGSPAGAPTYAPTDRAAFWLPLAGAVLTSTGVALWLFS